MADTSLPVVIPQWTTALPDWKERIKARQSLMPCPPLFESEAEAALRVFKSLRIVDVAGRPTFGEASEEWVFDFVRSIFGAYHAESAVRLIDEFFLLIAKKNGKSTLAAGVMLTALIRNWRYEAELLILAPTLEVANNAFKPAAAMIRADPNLIKLFKIKDAQKTIEHLQTGAVLKVVAADPKVVGGKKAAFVFIDELWLFGKMAGADTMFDEATGGRSSRKEGFVIYASTHSDEVPAGVFRDKLDLFRGIRDGTIVDPAKMAFLYEYPPEMIEAEAYLDPSTWFIPNPNLGKSASAEWIQKKLDEATDEGKKRQALAKWLNVEIGMKLRGDRWPGAKYWEKATHPELSATYRKDPMQAFFQLVEMAECITVGADGGGLDDLFGLTVLARLPGEIEVDFEILGRPVKQKMKRWASWSHAWCHKDLLENRPKIATNLEAYEKAGELTIVGDELMDLASIVEIIKFVKEAEKLGAVGVDPAGLGELVDMLQEIGITEENGLLQGVSQGFGMMNAIKTTERRLARGLLLHCGGWLMPWCVSNLKIEPTATAIRATKQHAGDLKIDPVMALFDAASVMVKNPQPLKKKSTKVYRIA